LVISGPFYDAFPGYNKQNPVITNKKLIKNKYSQQIFIPKKSRQVENILYLKTEAKTTLFHLQINLLAFK
jgi:hypothetical protein